MSGGGETTRFAPSPTGRLHAGHAFAALFAARAAAETGGRFLLRIEDIDAGRARTEFEAAIFEDLAWLGLDWERPVRRQSEHRADYDAAIARLEAAGLLYPCFCTRSEIAAEIARSADAPQGPDGPLYPGICRALPAAERAARRAGGEPFALRLDMARALEAVRGPLVFEERGRGPAGEHGRIQALPGALGDVVLARKDGGASYHIAVTVDDALQGVSLVTRGEDLFASTHLHRLLLALLGLPVPRWQHHRLIRDAAGARLAKRTGGTSLADLRAAGVTPQALLAEFGL
ncbi:MAG: tRNA glutamyl-Q(34) synthetase GluQRS [Alphaproteobacteria bacterium]|nr:tRNA glutamyl-Q(34) synthetase GluQRS [Alphaproteobacteria bacterium]